MSEREPIEPSERNAGGDDSTSLSKPDWLVGADEGANAETEALRLAGTGPIRPLAPRPVAPPPRDSSPEPNLVLVPPALDEEPADEPQPTPEEPVAERAWKAAASSVPRLLVKPAASAQPPEPEAFPGFTQDEMSATRAVAIGGGGTQTGTDAPTAANEAASPLAADPPFWVLWLDGLRTLPRPVLYGLGAVIVLGLATWIFYPRETPGVSLAQIRQHPEAFEGRTVSVGGKAGEVFSVGDSYVYNLFQGRDTIVVYSRSRRPAIHEHVKVDGTVSIGYLDGAPRVAVLETPAGH
jgi:hypothetical protein